MAAPHTVGMRRPFPDTVGADLGSRSFGGGAAARPRLEFAPDDGQIIREGPIADVALVAVEADVQAAVQPVVFKAVVVGVRPNSRWAAKGWRMENGACDGLDGVTTPQRSSCTAHIRELNFPKKSLYSSQIGPFPSLTTRHLDRQVVYPAPSPRPPDPRLESG